MADDQYQFEVAADGVYGLDEPLPAAMVLTAEAFVDDQSFDPGSGALGQDLDRASRMAKLTPELLAAAIVFAGAFSLTIREVYVESPARVINALIAARKSYDLLLFPNARHGPRKEADRLYMEERIRDFFLQNL
jgi:hypothetical protein